MRYSILASFILAAVVTAVPLTPDSAGAAHVGNGKGEQFITGQCLSNADCASACCATLGNIGICSGPGASTQQGKTGCGFGGGAAPAAPPPPPPPAAPANNAGAGAAASGLKPDPNGVPHIGNGKGEQFITGQCLNNADCASACCATLGDIGICSGPGASTQQGKTGCGFGGGAAPAAPPPPAAPANNAGAGAAVSGLKPDPNGVPHIGNGQGEQFITGQCLSNADCASACCATLGDIGICSGPGASTQQGKTGCGFVSKRALPL